MAKAIIRLVAQHSVVSFATALEVADQLMSEDFEFHGIQIRLWLMIAAAESRLSVLAKRRKRRNERWKRLENVSGLLKKEHLDALKVQIYALENCISTAKQIGDGLAWNLAKGDPRFVLPLFRPSTHQLPQGIAVDTYFRVLEAAENSGMYRVVLTDLTRCCGVGDLLIEGASWPHPSTFEVKAKAQPDGSINCFLHGNSIAFQLHPEELERFESVFGGKLPDRIRFDERGERQAREVDEETSRAFQGFVNTIKFDTPVLRRNWTALEGVVVRALAGKVGCDLAEAGVAYVAFKSNAFGSNKIIESVWSTLERMQIVQSREEWVLVGSYDLRMEPVLSALALPFLLWKLPPRCRAALMTSDVHLVTVFRRGVWIEAFRRENVAWREVDGTWRLTAHGPELAFDSDDVIRLQAGLAYAGVSPKEAAKHAALKLRFPERVTVQRYRTSNEEPLEWFEIRSPPESAEASDE